MFFTRDVLEQFVSKDTGMKQKKEAIVEMPVITICFKDDKNYEYGTDLNISVNQAIPLIVFVNHIQGFSIPGSESSPFPIFNIISEYSEKLCGFAFKIAHLPCCACDFLKC